MELKEIEKLAEYHIGKYLPDWSFKFKNTISMIGYCSFTKNTIYFSKVYSFLSKDIIENTILHEIAHALAPEHGHNKIWKSVAEYIGCKNPGYNYTLN